MGKPRLTYSLWPEIQSSMLSVERRIKFTTLLTPHPYVLRVNQTLLGIVSGSPFSFPQVTSFSIIVNHFRMPSEESGGVGNFWYSFDYGLAHFIMIDSETDFPVGIQSPDEAGGYDAGANSGPFGYPNQQYDWFESDLASVNREKTPWVIVGLHRPWYVGAQNDSGDVCLPCQQAFEPLMIKYGVDLYMQGHVHVSVTDCDAISCSYFTNFVVNHSFTSGMHQLPTVRDQSPCL